MYVECHTAKIMHKWSANNGRLLTGAVLVEFTLHDGAFQNQHLSGRLIEYVCLQTDPEYSDKFKIRKLGRRACEQVRRYFDGEGERENLFADGPDSPQDDGLSPAEEAELQAELRSIELEFEYSDLPALGITPVQSDRHPAPVA
ncbi:hypothetical protein [uncultured Roseovarius sp.]|uniref:hypothetical protein n=1 Tax=uncultured Roseovarius sp. TaxID=293344 RepID=UPI00262B66E2|nr:hypothetical protein [uncultured Roseovarius sp.]